LDIGVAGWAPAALFVICWLCHFASVENFFATDLKLETSPTLPSAVANVVFVAQ
jgi:hypothetical protein